MVVILEWQYIPGQSIVTSIYNSNQLPILALGLPFFWPPPESRTNHLALIFRFNSVKTRASDVRYSNQHVRWCHPNADQSSAFLPRLISSSEQYTLQRLSTRQFADG